MPAHPRKMASAPSGDGAAGLWGHRVAGYLHLEDRDAGREPM